MTICSYGEKDGKYIFDLDRCFLHRFPSELAKPVWICSFANNESSTRHPGDSRVADFLGNCTFRGLEIEQDEETSAATEARFISPDCCAGNRFRARYIEKNPWNGTHGITRASLRNRKDRVATRMRIKLAKSKHQHRVAICQDIVSGEAVTGSENSAILFEKGEVSTRRSCENTQRGPNCSLGASRFRWTSAHAKFTRSRKPRGCRVNKSDRKI